MGDFQHTPGREEASVVRITRLMQEGNNPLRNRMMPRPSVTRRIIGKLVHTDDPMTRKRHDIALVEQELTHEIIGSFYTAYNDLGYGFLEKVYANALSLELRRRNLQVEREVPVEVQYLGQPVGQFRMDLVVDHKVLVEIKSTSTVGDADRRQVFNYLRASVLPIALLLHFGPKPDFQRFISPRLPHSTDRAHSVSSV